MISPKRNGHRLRHHNIYRIAIALVAVTLLFSAPAVSSKSKFRLDRQERDPNSMTMLYVTTRWNEGSQNSPVYGIKRHLDVGSGSLEFGTAKVKRPGQLLPIEKATDWFTYLGSVKDNDTKWQAAAVGNLRTMDEDEMFSQIKDWKGTICVYTHGYDESFESAMRDAAVVAYEFDRRSNWTNATLPILFAWPSANKLQDYAEDEANVEWSGQAFADFITKLNQEKNESARIYVVAHSLGTRMVFGLLNRNEIVESAPINKLILSASDYDYFSAQQRFDKLEQLVKEKIFVFSSDRDGPLITSHLIHGSPRLGRPFDAPKVQTHLEDYMAKGAWKQLMDQAADVVMPGGLNNPPEVPMWLAKKPELDCELGIKSKWMDVSEMVSKDAGHRLAWPLIANLLADDTTLLPLATTVVYKRPDETTLQQNFGFPTALYRFHRVSGAAYGMPSPMP